MLFHLACTVHGFPNLDTSLAPGSTLILSQLKLALVAALSHLLGFAHHGEAPHVIASTLGGKLATSGSIGASGWLGSVNIRVLADGAAVSFMLDGTKSTGAGQFSTFNVRAGVELEKAAQERGISGRGYERENRGEQLHFAEGCYAS